MKALSKGLLPVLAASGLVVLGTVEPVGGVMLNGVECSDMTVTASTTNGVLGSQDYELEIHNCGSDGISPFQSAAPDCGNAQIDAGEQCDGASLGGQTCSSRGFDFGDLACNGVCTFDESGCENDGPTPTPTPTPPTGNPDCPDGYLTERFGSGLNQFGAGRISVPPGTTRKFCAKVDTPLVPSDFTINRIYFNWGDVTDYECGEVEVTMQQTFAPYLKRGPAVSTNGILRFNRTSYSGGYGSNSSCEDCVERGVYTITIKGIRSYSAGDPRCAQQDIAWGFN